MGGVSRGRWGQTILQDTGGTTPAPRRKPHLGDRDTIENGLAHGTRVLDTLAKSVLYFITFLQLWSLVSLSTVNRPGRRGSLRRRNQDYRFEVAQVGHGGGVGGKSRNTVYHPEVLRTPYRNSGEGRRGGGKDTRHGNVNRGYLLYRS